MRGITQSTCVLCGGWDCPLHPFPGKLVKLLGFARLSKQRSIRAQSLAALGPPQLAYLSVIP